MSISMQKTKKKLKKHNKKDMWISLTLYKEKNL